MKARGQINPRRNVTDSSERKAARHRNRRGQGGTGLPKFPGVHGNIPRARGRVETRSDARPRCFAAAPSRQLWSSSEPRGYPGFRDAGASGIQSKAGFNWGDGVSLTGRHSPEPGIGL